MLVLEVEDEYSNRALFEFGKGDFLIGKGDHCDLILSDCHVSRRHAELKVSDQAVEIQDLNSTNGTWLNGQRLVKKSALRQGDRITFGDLRVQLLSFSAADYDTARLNHSERPFESNQPALSAKQYKTLKSTVYQEVVAGISNQAEICGEARERLADQLIQQALASHNNRVGHQVQRATLAAELMSEVVGLGALGAMLEDDRISSIMINGPDEIFVEMAGRKSLTGHYFISDESMNDIIQRYLGQNGLEQPADNPLVEAHLSDGARIKLIRPPLVSASLALVIVKPRVIGTPKDDLLCPETLPADALDLIRQAVALKQSILVCGSADSGKSTLLKHLVEFISEDERVICIEPQHELNLQRKHVVNLVAGTYSTTRLLKAALGMKPDRLVIGELSNELIFLLLEAVAEGMSGVLASVRANSVKQLLNKLELAVALVKPELPRSLIRQFIVSSLDLVVFQRQMQDGVRKVAQIVEITGSNGHEIDFKVLFDSADRSPRQPPEAGLQASGRFPKGFSPLQNQPAGAINAGKTSDND